MFRRSDVRVMSRMDEKTSVRSEKGLMCQCLDVSVGWYVSSIICTFFHSDWLVFGKTVSDNRDNTRSDPKPSRICSPAVNQHCQTRSG